MMSESTTKPNEQLKNEVRGFWNRQSCDTNATAEAKFSRGYFEDIEAFRYADQPFIHSFAQFSRYRDKRVLEVGFGAGTDFIQWLRAGAIASGIDLTPEALENLRHRILAYHLPQPESIQVGDAENLPFADGSFDLGYSFGVLHHTPDTERSLRELVRVVKPGGEIKVMLYNRHSMLAFKLWAKYALGRGEFWRSLAYVMFHHLESKGTKGYTRGELRKILSALPLEDVRVRTEITSADYLAFSKVKPVNLICRAMLRLVGDQRDWLREEYVTETDVPKPLKRSEISFSGNRLGWFHCIRAVKKHA